MFGALVQQPVTEFVPLFRLWGKLLPETWPVATRSASQRNTRTLFEKEVMFQPKWSFDSMAKHHSWEHLLKADFSSYLADPAVDLALTVAKPQSTLLIFSIDSTASLPSSKSVGSLVARYRYIALSISSAEKNPNVCKYKDYQIMYTGKIRYSSK